MKAANGYKLVIACLGGLIGGGCGTSKITTKVETYNPQLRLAALAGEPKPTKKQTFIKEQLEEAINNEQRDEINLSVWNSMMSQIKETEQDGFTYAGEVGEYYKQKALTEKEIFVTSAEIYRDLADQINQEAIDQQLIGAGKSLNSMDATVLLPGLTVFLIDWYPGDIMPVVVDPDNISSQQNTSDNSKESVIKIPEPYRVEWQGIEVMVVLNGVKDRDDQLKLVVLNSLYHLMQERASNDKANANKADPIGDSQAARTFYEGMFKTLSNQLANDLNKLYVEYFDKKISKGNFTIRLNDYLRIYTEDYTKAFQLGENNTDLNTFEMVLQSSPVVKMAIKKSTDLEVTARNAIKAGKQVQVTGTSAINTTENDFRGIQESMIKGRSQISRTDILYEDYSNRLITIAAMDDEGWDAIPSTVKTFAQGNSNIIIVREGYNNYSVYGYRNTPSEVITAASPLINASIQFAAQAVSMTTGVPIRRQNPPEPSDKSENDKAGSGDIVLGSNPESVDDGKKAPLDRKFMRAMAYARLTLINETLTELKNVDPNANQAEAKATLIKANSLLQPLLPGES